MNRAIVIDAADGNIDAHVFTPDGANMALPGVILFTDIGGLRPCYYAKAQAVAERGYAVLMPNIYYRDTTGAAVPEGRSFHDADVRPTLMQYADHLTPDAQQRDFQALLSGVDDADEFTTGDLAVVGYCMTGAFAVRMAATHPERIAAAAGFHSSRLAKADDPASPVNILATIRAQVYLGHADQDELMPAAQIAAMDAALAEAGVHYTTELYAGARHGFTAKDAPNYHAEADARHYKRLFTLLEEALD